MINHVKEIRVSLGMTQQELGDLLKVSRQTIFSIETGKYVPSTILSLKISKIFNKSVEEVFVLEKHDYLNNYITGILLPE
jgi:putative transcriptional regulator